MLPLVLPEPAAAPPAIPASVATPNENAGAAADHRTFAALVDAGADVPVSGIACAATAAKIAVKASHVAADNWLLAQLSAFAPADAGTEAPAVVTLQHVDDTAPATDEDDEATESINLPLDTTTADISVLCGECPSLPQASIRIPIPGDEDGDEDLSPASADDAPDRTRFTVAFHPDHLTQAAAPDLPTLVTPAVDERVQAAPAELAQTPSAELAQPAQEELPQYAHADLPTGSSQPSSEPVAAQQPLLVDHVSAAVTHDVADAPRISSLEQRPVELVTEQRGTTDDIPADVPEPAVPTRARQSESAPRSSSDGRNRRADIPSRVGRGPILRSAVASAVTSSDKPADAVHAIVDAGLAAATPAQAAAGVTREAPATRSAPPESSRRIDVTTLRTPFSTDGDASDSGSREQETRGRHASAMSARLAAAVASTSDVTASRSAGVAPVFVIPTATPTASQPLAPAADAPIGTMPTLPAENVERLVQTMHVNVKSGVMEATVRLRPEYLGEVTIQLRVDGASVSAVIQTEASGVRQWLESQEQAIRNGLAAHGLDLERLLINPDGERQQQPRNEADTNQSRRRPYRRHQQSTERFEITV